MAVYLARETNAPRHRVDRYSIRYALAEVETVNSLYEQRKDG